MDGKIPITKQGMDKIKAELKILMSVERPQIQKAIAEARAHGDLSENAEYHAAKERQGFIEGRIQDITAKMPKFQVVEPARHNSDYIAFGATVTMQNLTTEEQLVYQIVGPDETNPEQRKISYLSPIAKALIGKGEGDVVKIAIPRGQIEVEITKVDFV